MQTHLQKWGNSLGVRIPAQLAAQLHLIPNSPIDIYIEDEHLVIKRKKHSLAEFLSQINQDNLHHEAFDDDTSKGTEVW
jgi:antitoxin MazE